MKTTVILIFIFFGLAYLFLIDNKKAGPYVKVLPALTLAGYSLYCGNLPFALVYLLAGAGDYLLTHPGKFFWGAAVFAIAYSTLNLVTFAHFSPLYLLAILPCAALVFLIGKGLVREKVFFPLLAYGIVVIAGLVVNAMGHLFHSGMPLTGLGLLSLAVSDLIIATRFAHPRKYLSYLIMVTYYTGLLLVF